jgi:hypothetical protein
MTTVSQGAAVIASFLLTGLVPTTLARAGSSNLFGFVELARAGGVGPRPVDNHPDTTAAPCDRPHIRTREWRWPLRTDAAVRSSCSSGRPRPCPTPLALAPRIVVDSSGESRSGRRARAPHGRVLIQASRHHKRGADRWSLRARPLGMYNRPVGLGPNTPSSGSPHGS